MDTHDTHDGLTPKAVASLELPAAIETASYATALDIDTALAHDEGRAAALEAKVAAHREVTLTHLMTHRGTQVFDPTRFRWPQSLFIPRGANARDYWFSPAPDDHRYGLDWIAPPSATQNKASSQDGTLSAFSQLLNATPGRPQSSEAGLGVFYTPTMSLGVVALEPTVTCAGSLRTMIENFPQLVAGSVEVKVSLQLAAWQKIPGGFDLLGYRSFAVATSGRRDQSHGAELQSFQRAFSGANLSAPFVVQSGRTYLLGVVARVDVLSTLTTNTGAALPAVSNTLLRVWGQMNCLVPQIDVVTKRVDIP